jgi:hypothetical protein
MGARIGASRPVCFHAWLLAGILGCTHVPRISLNWHVVASALANGSASGQSEQAAAPGWGANQFGPFSLQGVQAVLKLKPVPAVPALHWAQPEGVAEAADWSVPPRPLAQTGVGVGGRGSDAWGRGACGWCVHARRAQGKVTSPYYRCSAWVNTKGTYAACAGAGGQVKSHGSSPVTNASLPPRLALQCRRCWPPASNAACTCAPHNGAGTHLQL